MPLSVIDLLIMGDKENALEISANIFQHFGIKLRLLSRIKFHLSWQI